MEETKMMPRYKCHKEVHAIRIAAIEPRPENRCFILTAAAPFEGHTFSVGEDWRRRCPNNLDLAVGGYYIVYKDGYESWSPAEAFEDGYTLIEE